MNYDKQETKITIETDDLNMTYIIFKSGDCKQLNELSKKLQNYFIHWWIEKR